MSDRTTKLYRESVRAVQTWCRKERLGLLKPPRHVFPRAYVVGYAAPGCLIVAQPWPDAEAQVRGFTQANPLTTIHRFDPSLKAGDWCITAYITHRGSGEQVAIPTARIG